MVNGGKGTHSWRGSVGRHQVRHTGLAALALLSVTVVAALVLARLSRLGVAAVAVTIIGGLPALYLAWVPIRDARRDAGRGENLAEVADQLADAVDHQWKTEARMRRLNDPYPLPVSWAAADPSLTDGWHVLVKLATSGAGWPPPPLLGTWAASADDLAGGEGELVEVLARVPTGRLVVLGEPGAGKTILMVRLVLDLLERRERGAGGGPVPVLVSLASWNPDGQDLHRWLAAQLTIDHPDLAAAAPPGTGKGARIDALLAAGRILPILDGLDEIPEAIRGPAIARINDALRPGEHLVLTCRTAQYQDAVRPPEGAEVTLRAAAAVQLRPLDAETVADYLRADAPGPVAAARWDPVLTVLGTQAPAGQALATPLMVGLARVIYNPRPGETAGKLRDPAELCSPTLGDRAAVEGHLFDGFIPAVYRPCLDGRWTKHPPEPWLVFLARHLEHTVADPGLAWWQLQLALPSLMFPVVSGLAAGLAIGLAIGLTAGLVTGLVAGLAAVVLFGGITWILTVVSEESSGVGQLIVFWLVAGTLGGFVLVIVVGVLAGAVAAAVSGFVLVVVTGFLALATVKAAFLSGLELALPVVVTGDLKAAADPAGLLARNRRAALARWLFIVLVFTLTSVFLAEVLPARGHTAEILAAAGFGAGLALGFIFSEFGTPWPSYVIAVGWLALHRRLPWSLMAFLADAHRKGVLRQSGAVYQFRHIELQHRLASRP